MSRRALGLGVAAGCASRLLAVLGAWFAAPRLSPIVVTCQISGAPCMGEDRGHGVDLGNGGWRARCVALRLGVTQEPELPEADLGVVRLDRRESTPRGGPTGVVPREPLERP